MRVAQLGLGRLGLPIAAILSQHHAVTGYDPDPSTAERLKVGHPWEVGLDEFLNDRIALAPSIDAATYDADVVVVCVQTPHHPRLDGTHPDDGTREPFDLSFVADALGEIDTDAPVVLMSTVLPGDTRKLSTLVDGPLIYSPAFPAMGTTVRDVLDPEFILVGHETVPAEGEYVYSFGDLWGPVYLDRLDLPVLHVSWETAELAKMAYNTAVTQKITLGNTVGWIANEVGADGGAVMSILASASRRIASSAYLQPGLGDSGACHPRDLIAMSYLAQKVGAYDFYGDLISHRNQHSLWVATEAQRIADEHELADVVILGSAYKANSTLIDGSAALLMARQTGWPVTDNPDDVDTASVVVIGVPHDRYRTLDLPDGSVVVDVWGHVEGENVIRLGRRA